MVRMTTGGGSSSAADGDGRGQPVEPRHPDVHQHDVGPAAAHRLDGVGAVVGLADHGDVVGRLEDHPQPGPDQRLVVDDERRGSRDAPGRRRCGTAPRRATAARPRPASRRPASARRRASRRRARPARAGRAGRRRSPAAARPPPTGRRLTTSTVHAVRLVAGDRHRRSPRRGRACARWSAPPARRGGPCGPTASGSSSTSIAQLGLHPGGPRRLDEPARCRRGRGGGARSVPSAPAPARSTPSTSRRSSIASRAVVRISAGRLADLLRPGVGVDLERAGVQGDQRHLVGQHVVHLPGDPGPLAEPGLLGPQLLLAPRPAPPGRAARRRGRGGRRRTRRRPRRSRPRAAPSDDEPRPSSTSLCRSARRRRTSPTATSGHQRQHAVPAPDGQREQPDGQRRPARRVTANTTMPISVTATGCAPAPPQRRGADQRRRRRTSTQIAALRRAGGPSVSASAPSSGDGDERDVAGPRPDAGPRPSSAAVHVVTGSTLGTAPRRRTLRRRSTIAGGDHRLSSGVRRRPAADAPRRGRGARWTHDPRRKPHQALRPPHRRRRRLLHLPTRAPSPASSARTAPASPPPCG